MFGEKLKSLRTQRGYSMDALSKLYNEKYGGHLNKSTISRYENGLQEPIFTVVKNLAELFHISVDSMSGREETAEYPASPIFPQGFDPPPKTVKRPRLGVIACGTPILAEENFDGYDSVPENIPCDFTLKCQGDSMINARIMDGDIVYIRQQPTVENGEIAAVRINGETTLKRYHRQGGAVILQPENPAYAPMVFTGEALSGLEIIGKAVGFTSLL